jgi:hypothetical protein
MTSNPRYTMLDSTDIRCTRCGYENDPQFRFCGMCGAALRPLQAEDREADANAQNLPAQVTPNKLPQEPMPVEPLLAQLTAAQKFHPERLASPPASSYSSELRNEVYGAEPIHGQRTPVSVTGPSFLGLSESSDRGVEYLLEDEPHPGRKRTVLALLLLLIVAGAWILHWRKTGSTWPFQSSAPVASKSSSSPQDAPVMPSEVAPPMANDQQKLEKPMTGVGDRPLTDDNAKTDDGAKSNNTASSNQIAAPDNSGNPASGKPTSGNEAANTAQPPSTKKTQSDDAGTAEATAPSSRKSAGDTNRADRSSDSAALATAASNPAEDSLYLEGQKYLYGGHGVRQNCAQARQDLLAAANNDNSKAESTLGTMYATGHCAPRDIPQAYRWFARALHADPRNTRLEKDAEIMWNQMTPPERQLALKNQ